MSLALKQQLYEELVILVIYVFENEINRLQLYFPNHVLTHLSRAKAHGIAACILKFQGKNSSTQHLTLSILTHLRYFTISVSY